MGVNQKLLERGPLERGCAIIDATPMYKLPHFQSYDWEATKSRWRHVPRRSLPGVIEGSPKMARGVSFELPSNTKRGFVRRIFRTLKTRM